MNHKANLNKVKSQLTRFISFRREREIVFKDIKIYYETDSAILVELEDQSVWLPKAEIKIEKQKKSATITVPFWLVKKKFPAHKYKQFSNI